MVALLGPAFVAAVACTLTMLPALVVLGLNLPATASLVISQVVLSFGIPFALVPLVLLTRRADIMGALVNRRLTTAVTAGIASVIIVLNIFLIYVTFAGWRGRAVTG